MAAVYYNEYAAQPDPPLEMPAPNDRYFELPTICSVYIIGTSMKNNPLRNLLVWRAFDPFGAAICMHH